MPATEPKIRNAATEILQRAADNISRIILGKDEQIRLALTCLVARGHLLIEDLPGVGKTTLAHAIAQVMGLEFQRIQFTSDLLPADVLGVAVYERERAVFEFHQGPIFSNFILADEINRATPKTQSALLEAMEESQVTVDGETRDLPQPFFVIATQNPMHQIGTYALPESQLDRFLMRLHLGFPGREAERELLQGEERRDMIEHIKPVLDGGQLITIQKQAAGIHVADALLDYVQSLLEFTRNCRELTDNTRVTPDRRYDHNVIRRGIDTLRGCRIDKMYPLSEAQAQEIGALVQATDSGN